MHPVILIHGGAWDIPDSLVISHLEGVRNAALQGIPFLTDSALDAVEAAICYMEDDPTFDAGTGSFLNKSGEVELDAIIMEGTTMSMGAVGAVKKIKNPISLARRVMERCSTLFLVGSGAEQFALEQGIQLINNNELIVEREKERWNVLIREKKSTEEFFKHGTVGAVALDVNGRLVAGTSTGGTPFKQPGRIGDSPLIGAGTYATEYCAISCTGWGEAIMKAGLAKTAADLIEEGLSPQDAAQESIDLLKDRFSGYGGIIIVDNEGKSGIAYNTPRMAWSLFRETMKEPESHI
ncbi:MAG: isoaspartyl peptidase/L-asparaginase [Theionarchaea archaeon]|nr:isoaspartyl peptidase/L-asparaginase [Theionarchaea archaeon]